MAAFPPVTDKDHIRVVAIRIRALEDRPKDMFSFTIDLKQLIASKPSWEGLSEEVVRRAFTEIPNVDQDIPFIFEIAYIQFENGDRLKTIDNEGEEGVRKLLEELAKRRGKGFNDIIVFRGRWSSKKK